MIFSEGFATFGGLPVFKVNKQREGRSTKGDSAHEDNQIDRNGMGLNYFAGKPDVRTRYH
jgi:hypothetical protein